MRASETGHSLVKASELIGHRRVFRTEDLTEEDIALIAKSEVPPGYEHLDDELNDEAP